MSARDNDKTRAFSRKADLRGSAFAINRVQAAIDRVRIICEERGVDRIATDAIVTAVNIAVTEMCTGRVEGDS